MILPTRVLVRMRYTIEYVDHHDGAERRSTVAMAFRDKQSALDGAAALMRSGISVSKVEGPGFQMHRTALVAYCKIARARALRGDGRPRISAVEGRGL